MSDDAEKLLADIPTVSELLEQFIAKAIANAMADARDEAIEECAQVADNWARPSLAAAIRALAKRASTPPTD